MELCVYFDLPAWITLYLTGLCVYEEKRCDCRHHYLWPPLQPGPQQPPVWETLVRPEHHAGRGELLVWSAVCLPQHALGYGITVCSYRLCGLLPASHGSSSFPNAWGRFRFVLPVFCYLSWSPCASRKAVSSVHVILCSWDPRHRTIHLKCPEQGSNTAVMIEISNLIIALIDVSPVVEKPFWMYLLV